jgi:cellobiose phosphorylase
MQYGHFDDINREYIITRPDTPRSWSNYLGSTEYGAIITNNAGGYSFFKSGGSGRFTRFRFNAIPMDQPGRYLYLRDNDDGDYWSSSWQPVGKSLEHYRSRCRHGLGYTTIESDYRDISSAVTYFVPRDKHYEVWLTTITNHSNRPRNLSLFTYVEYAGNWNAMDDMLNLQYTQYTAQMRVQDGIIDHGTNVYIPPTPEQFHNKDQGRHSFLTFANLAVAGFDTDREAFLGPYRSYANPLVVEQGECTNSQAWGNNPCGTLQGRLTLAPGQSSTFAVIMGIGEAATVGKRVREHYRDIATATTELEQLKAYWALRIGSLSATTPDAALNSTLNVWGIYNCHITFAWSRAASLIYTASERDGYGYRDTVQDTLGVTHGVSAEVRERLVLMLSGQCSSGGALPVVRPTHHEPGAMSPPEEFRYRSDDALWLFFAIPNYVKESGEIDFYHTSVPYADTGEDSVLGHLRRALMFNLNRRGAHGLPCGLSADWNDCLCFGTSGESVFVALQLRHALATYEEIAALLTIPQEQQWAAQQRATLDCAIQKVCWDGAWFVRGFREDGHVFGSQVNSEGKIFLNPQSWAVIAGAATNEQAQKCLESSAALLATEYGLRICEPPFEHTDHQIVKASLMNPGLKENGGIFIHPQPWAVMAEALQGNGNRAFEYLQRYLPAFQNDQAEIREVEPYVVCQSTCGPAAPTFGRSRVPWLTGAASWTYYVLSQYILGIRPHYRGLELDPCIPAAWPGFTVKRIFRGTQLHIRVDNSAGVQKGVRLVRLNAQPYGGTIIDARDLQSPCEIDVIMG